MGDRLCDLRGKAFGRLAVLARAKNDKWKRARWLCRCRCGRRCTIPAHDLKTGHTRSCGCYQTEVNTRRIRRVARRHGLAGTPEHNSWIAAKARCFNVNDPSYRNYGGRGITMCAEWAGSFEAFLRDLGPRPQGKTLDRIDVNGHYEPGNCRWATATQQSKNRRLVNDVTNQLRQTRIMLWAVLTANATRET